MGDSLLARSIGVMIFPRKTFQAASENHHERHIVVLSLVFGFLLARHIIRPENHDLFFYVTTSLSCGIGFVYFAGFFLSWLIEISGPYVRPEKMRMVLAYSLTPYILALTLAHLSKWIALPKTSSISFFLIIFSWGLAVFGVRVITGIRLAQSLMVIVIPVAALLLVVAILFKVAWMISGV